MGLGRDTLHYAAFGPAAAHRPDRPFYMRLSGIKLAGFKSFVDPSQLPLPSNLTSIVGPNGCGKSNIIDAVRWVLGETSMKNLQVKNVGHTALTYDPGVYILVRKELEAASKLWAEREGTTSSERQPTFY